jgi:hypothetical protein
MKKLILILSISVLTIYGCKKDPIELTPPPTYNPNLVFVFEFDSTQVRLNNFGQPSTIPSGNSAQSPVLNNMSAHYIELAQGMLTPIGEGVILYHAEETEKGGENAIDFSKAVLGKHGDQFFKIPIKDVAKGEYEYLRISLGYQNFDVKFHIDTTFTVAGLGEIHVQEDFPATVAGFVGFNTYITNFLIKNQSVEVNSNKKQGFWGFETSGSISGFPFNHHNTGQAPEGSTTVVNPIFSTSPIPQGSCLVTGAFHGEKLKITGNETKDITIRVSLSTNKSFEWIDGNGNGKWEPTKGEKIVDMGLRGLIPFIQQ